MAVTQHPRTAAADGAMSTVQIASGPSSDGHSQPLPPSCSTCAHIKARGRNLRDPVHCRDCHQTWTGNQAPHCLGCHRTFTSGHASDKHRWTKKQNGECLDVTADPNWYERRPGVWTPRPKP